MNCFIETLSLIKNLYPESLYRVTDPAMLPDGITEKTFSGRQTNETPTKYYIWSFLQKRQVIDKIIVLVTKECVEDKVECIQGMTTYEYYFDSIKKYIEPLAETEAFLREYLNKNFNGSAEDYLKSVMTAIKVPDSFETSAWKDIVNALCGTGVDLYIDFTGGSRTASLISLLLVRIMENLDANVRQIIYSDINVRPFRLVDCTKIYSILSNIESIAKIHENSENVTSKIMAELAKMGLVSTEETGNTEELDREMEQSRNTFKQQKADDPKSDKTTQNKTVPVSTLPELVKQQAQKTITERNQMSGFMKLKQTRTKNKDLVLDFHEAIISILCSNNIILFNGNNKKYAEKTIQSEIKANEFYYSNPQKGVISFAKMILEYLDKNTNSTPTETYLNYLNPQNENFIQSVNNEKNIKGITFYENKKFMKYLANQNISLTENNFEKLLAIQRVYYNYGFPFMCTSVSGWFVTYPEVMEYYRKKVLALMQSFDDMKQKNYQDYIDKIKKLSQNESLLEKEIPYHCITKSWSMNNQKFADREHAQAFLKTLQERIEKVRPYRNAIAHHKDNEYSTPDAQSKISTEIRTWLDEYDSLFEVAT